MHIVINREEQHVEIDMISHIKESIKVIEDMGIKIDVTASTPATKLLFVVDENSKELNEELSEIFILLQLSCYL